MSTVIYIVACQISLLISFAISIFAWQRRRDAGAFALFFTTASQASWTFGIIAETVSPTLEGKIFWDNFQFIGWMFASAGILILALDFTRERSTRNVWIGILIIPIIGIILAFTDPMHGLIRPEAQLVEELGFVSLDYPFTTTMYLLALFTYVAIITSLVMLSRHMRSMVPEQRPQVGFMIAGVAIPIVGGILSLADVLPSALRDISPFTFGAGNLLIAIGLLRYQLFDISRFAREQIVTTMNTAVVAFDTRLYVSLVNPAAEKLIGMGQKNIGKKAPSFLLEWLQEAQVANKSNERFIASLEKDAQTHSFIVAATSLKDNRGNALGEALVVNDITQQQKTEQELLERTQALEEQSQIITQNAEKLRESNESAQKRANQLQALAKVSSSIARINNLEELLPEITRVINEQFGFYHIGIFLSDEADEYAILSASNSEGGKRMINRGHRLKIGEVGIVGNVVGTGTPRIALDTGADAVFFENPDLPDTHSEMALPLRYGEEIIGALDVQSLEPDAFGEDDVEVLTTLADQVSIAIQNARQFEATQKSLAEAEAIYRQYLRNEWSRVGQRQEVAGFSYSLLGTRQVEASFTTEEAQLAIEKGDLQIRETEGASALALPIKLRDEIIGVLNVRAPAGHDWSENEIDLVRAVADRVAISAENARLFEETTNRAERERIVADITNKIRSTNDPNEMLNTALAELQRALNVKKVQIVPMDSTGTSQK